MISIASGVTRAVAHPISRSARSALCRIKDASVTSTTDRQLKRQGETMFRHGFAVIALSLLTTLSASGEVTSTSNTPDLVAVDVTIDDSGALVAVIQNSGIAINSPFQAALSLDGHTTRTFAFGGSTRGQTPPVGGRGGFTAVNL